MFVVRNAIAVFFITLFCVGCATRRPFSEKMVDGVKPVNTHLLVWVRVIAGENSANYQSVVDLSLIVGGDKNYSHVICAGLRSKLEVVVSPYMIGVTDLDGKSSFKYLRGGYNVDLYFSKDDERWAPSSERELISLGVGDLGRSRPVVGLSETVFGTWYVVQLETVRKVPPIRDGAIEVGCYVDKHNVDQHNIVR